MTRHSTPQHYGQLSITLHWLMLLLFVGVYACIEIKGLMPRGGHLRSLFLGLHGVFGLSIFALVWVRLLARRLAPRPPIAPALPAWQTGMSHLMHTMLYILMIATPLLAWLLLSAEGKPMPYFGFFLPSPIAVDPSLAKQFKHWHELLGSTGYWLIGLHAATGLIHHYWVGDNTLTRILPRR